MDINETKYYKKKLIVEREKVKKLLNQMKLNGVYTNSEIASELSYYDNHPADLGTEMADIEKGRALKANELSLLNKIDSALKAIDDGKYGVCNLCGNKISKERLDFLPYVEYCSQCQNLLSESRAGEKDERPLEEEVLKSPFGYGYNDYNGDPGFDAEDSYQAVEKFNKMKNIEEFYDGDDDYVESVESISNEEYKSQLPD